MRMMRLILARLLAFGVMCGGMSVTAAAGSSAAAVQHQPSLPPASWTTPNGETMVNGRVGWGTDGRAILRTTNGGATWSNVTPAHFPADFAFEGVAALDAKTAWVPYGWTCTRAMCQTGSGVGGVLRTTDGGKTWKATSLGSPKGQQFITSSIDFINRDDGWLMVGHGGAAGSEAVDIYRTTDGGRAWRRVSGASFAPNPPAGSLPVGGDKSGIVFADALHGWVTGFSPAMGNPWIEKTTDGGRMWHHQSLPHPPGIDLSRWQVGTSVPRFFGARHGVLVITAGATIVYSTDDGGASWKPTAVIHAPYLTNVLFASMATGWAFDSHRQVLERTQDGGKTWHDVVVPAAAAGDNFTVVNAQTVVLWSLSSHHVWRTVDGGKSWTPITMTVAPLADSRLALSGKLIVDRRFGFRFTVPVGWTVQSGDGLPLDDSNAMGMAFPTARDSNEGMGITVCRGAGLCPDTAGFRTLKTVKGSTALGGVPATRYHLLMATVTETRVWGEVHVVASHAGYTYDVSIDLPVGQPNIVAKAYDSVLRSWRWIPVARSPAGFGAASLHMVSATTGWAVGERPGSLIMRTTDGGDSWTHVTPTGLPPGNDALGCHASFLNAQLAWLACPARRPAPNSTAQVLVWQTTDGGAAWHVHAVDTPLPAGSAFIPVPDFVDARHGWLELEPVSTMITPGDLLATDNGGATWTAVALAPHFPVAGPVAFVDAREGWLVGAPPVPASVNFDPDRMFRTDDGGRVWHRVVLPKVTVSGGQIEILSPVAPPTFTPGHPRDGVMTVTLMSARTGAGALGMDLLVTRDGGATWSPIPDAPGPGAGTNQFIDDFLGARVGWLWLEGSHDQRLLSPVSGGLSRWTWSGRHWTGLLGSLTDVVQLDFVSPQVGYALTRSPATSTGELWRTTDGGNSWTRRVAAT